MEFQHFILTRFNVKAKDWGEDSVGRQTLTSAWLDERFSLFLKYCLPSILNQSRKNFKWLIYFNNDIEEKYRDVINSLCLSNKYKAL